MNKSSYNQRKAEIQTLKDEIEVLKQTLNQQGITFFKNKEFIGYDKIVYGVVKVNGVHEILSNEISQNKALLTIK